jgi:16S rRNA processing protein RimM
MAARIFIGRTQLDARMMHVEGLRGAPGRALLKLTGIDTPDRAKTLTGARVFLRRSDFPPAGEGEYYWVDLIGLRVRTPDEDLGMVEEIVETPAFDVLVVREGAGGPGPRNERLIPFTRSALREVCPEEGVLRVHPPQAWEVESEDPALARKPSRAPRGERGGSAAGRPGGLRSRKGGK